MPRPEFPDGLFLSVSQIKCFTLCPRRYLLKYVRGEPPAFVPVALAFGSAFHAALAAYYSELKTAGSPLRRDLLLDVFRAAWEKESTGSVPLQADDDDPTDDLVGRGIAMLHAFHEHAAKDAHLLRVEAVEKPFTVSLHDPDTGEVLDEQLVGVMDLLVRDPDRVVVVEHKSSAKKYGADQLRYDLQATAYKLAMRQLGLGEVGLKYQIVTKSKVPAIQIADVGRTEQDEIDFLRVARGVLRAIDAGVEYPVRGWACRSCPWSGPCGAP